MPIINQQKQFFSAKVKFSLLMWYHCSKIHLIMNPIIFLLSHTQSLRKKTILEKWGKVIAVGSGNSVAILNN